MDRTKQKKWDAKNPEVIKKSQQKYNKKRPMWGFRPEDELLDWLESQKGDKETKADLLRRLLHQLKESA